MDPVTLIGLIAAAISAVSNIEKSRKAEGYQKKQEEALDKQNAVDKLNLQRRETEQRKASLARAIGSKNVYAPTTYEEDVDAPKEPDFTGENIAGGVANSLGAFANSRILNGIGTSSGINAGLDAATGSSGMGAPLGFNTDANSLNQLRRQSLSKYGGNH